MSTYRVQILRVSGRIEIDVHDCSSTEEAVREAVKILVDNPERAKEMFDNAQLTPAGMLVEFMERDVRVVL